MPHSLFDTRVDIFALVDAARDLDAVKMIREHGVRHASLYTGVSAELLGDYAPYLVDACHNSEFRRSLVDRVWGGSSCVFVESKVVFADLWSHFRRFLMVEDEAGRELYFRFYDPRVMRVFLPSCSHAEVAAFFGPVDAFLMEDASPAQMLTFRPGTQERPLYRAITTFNKLDSSENV
ncbi:MAG: DUF4123 domain-containing protein [Polyangiales bacterium]